MMLAGKPPFSGETEIEIIKAIRENQIDYKCPELAHVSPECLEFLDKLLEFSPEKRLTANQALGHDWIKLHDSNDRDIEITGQALVALAKFNT